MTNKQAKKVLLQYQNWRQYKGELTLERTMPDPADIGKAIDTAIEALEIADNVSYQERETYNEKRF